MWKGVAHGTGRGAENISRISVSSDGVFNWGLDIIAKWSWFRQLRHRCRSAWEDVAQDRARTGEAGQGKRVQRCGARGQRHSSPTHGLPSRLSLRACLLHPVCRGNEAPATGKTTCAGGADDGDDSDDDDNNDKDDHDDAIKCNDNDTMKATYCGDDDIDNDDNHNDK